MRGHRALGIVACALCLVVVFGGTGAARTGAARAATARAAPPRTIPAPAGLNAIGCMTPELCVVGGSSGLHHIPHVQILRGGRVTRTLQFQRGFIGQSAVNCPSARECVVVIDRGAAYSVLITVRADGHVSSPRALPHTRGSRFDQISCASARRCELAGEWNIGGDDPVVASWNGSRAGPVYALQTPANRNLVYGVDADLSCGGVRCEVSYTFSSAIKAAVRLSTIVAGGPPHPVILRRVHALSVACAADGQCRGALNSPFLGSSRIGQIVDGHLGEPRPSLHIQDSGLACQVTSCLAAGFRGNRSALVSIVGHRIGAPRSVSTVSDYDAVSAIPGGGFVAVGEARPDNQPVLTFTAGR
jgi:hypothetical protein